MSVEKATNFVRKYNQNMMESRPLLPKVGKLNILSAVFTSISNSGRDFWR